MSGPPLPQYDQYGNQVTYTAPSQPQYGQPIAYGQPQQYGQPVYGAPPSGYAPPTGHGYQASPPVASYPPQPQYGAPVYTTPGHPHEGGAPAHDHHTLLKSEQGERFAPKTGCRDPIWSFLFVAHFIAVVVIAIMMFSKYKDEMSESSDAAISLDGKTWGLIAILLCTGALVAAFWLQFIKSYAHCLIWFTLILSVAMCCFMAIAVFAAGNAVGGVIFLIFALLNALYIYLIRDRIEFSATILRIVSEVLKQYSSTFMVAFLSVIVQAVWLIIWVLAAAGSLQSLIDHQSSDGFTRLVYFFFLVSFYWTSQVISNIVHVTVAGTIASWYFLFPAHMPPNPTMGAFKRASWTSFGSIAFGSFIIAVIRALRAIVRQGRGSKNACAQCVVECLLGCLDNLVSYFNVYAFTQVAIYGKPYCEAASDTWSLFKRVGIEAIINDDIIGGVLMFASFIGACMCGALGALLAKFGFEITEWGYWVVIAFIIGFAMTMIVMEVVASAVCALFVCFSEDPAALQQSKPEVYGKFYTALTGHRYANQLHLSSA